MKKLYIAAFSLLAAVAFSSCEKQDTAPVLQEPTEFVLNNPAYVNTLYDLENSTSLTLTCSQPDYGFTAAVSYSVEVALGTAFTVDGKTAVLPTAYNTAKMNVDAAELAAAITQLAMDSGTTEDKFPLETAVCIRLRASLTNSGKGEIVSNAIVLPNVRCHFALPPVTLPKTMYMIGSMCDWNWGNSLAMVPVHSHEGYFWRLAYIPEGGAFKFNIEKAWDGKEFGFAGATNQDNAGAGISSSDDGNFVVAKAGWYIVVVRTSLNGRDYKYDVEFAEPKVYMIGLAAPVNDWTINESNLFEVPADGEGSFKSPAFTQDFPGDNTKGCLRACVKLSDADWWQTEFMVFDGVLTYRGTGDDQKRVGAKAGQSLYINFTAGTGEIK